MLRSSHRLSVVSFKEPRSPLPDGYVDREHGNRSLSRVRRLGAIAYRGVWRARTLAAIVLSLTILSLLLRLASEEPVSVASTPTEDLKAANSASAPSIQRELPVRHHENGFAYFDTTSKGEHPIISLMRNASQAWDEKVARQSKTLAEAVKEYERRYKRHPPKGFDRWYDFAEANNVVLIDEYDNIDRDIRPFFALEPSYLQGVIAEYATFPDVDTLVFKAGKVESVTARNAQSPRRRTLAQMELVKDCCASWLQDANITLTSDDGPAVAMSAEHRQLHFDAVEEGRMLSKEEAETVFYAPDHGNHWWSVSCPRGSRFRRSFYGLEVGALPSGPSFVSDHRSAMDLCRNPENQQLHGFTSWNGRDTIKLYPVFAQSRPPTHSDLRVTPLEQYKSRYLDVDPEWDDKPYSAAAWRGGTTGVLFKGQNPWQGSQRVRMYWLANNATGMRTVHMPMGDSAFEKVEMDLSKLGPAYLDVRFVGTAAQCYEADGSCERVRQAISFVPYTQYDQLLKYKYLLDIDGNAWSGRFHRLMSSNSLVLKSTIFDEWYSDRIQPWLHYVPVKLDYTDLFDIMAFFSGDLSGRGHHDHLAKSIAYAGKEWAAKHWRMEDMQAYNARLYLEWARLTAPDRASMDYVL